MYSNKLIKLGLRHMREIDAGNPPLKKAADSGFIKSGRKGNAGETFLIWSADIKEAMEKLCPDSDLLHNMFRDVGWEILRANLHKLPAIQRYLINHCIFGECYYCQNMRECPEEKLGEYCDESSNVSRMRRILNGEEDITAPLTQAIPEVTRAKKAWLGGKRNLKQYKKAKNT